MADALATAVERLRARAEEPPPEGMQPSAGAADVPPMSAGGPTAPAPVAVQARPPTRWATGRMPRQVAPQIPPPALVPKMPRYKHSLSLIGRWRLRRKQRRARRGL
jgi:hypothetical protein